MAVDPSFPDMMEVVKGAVWNVNFLPGLGTLEIGISQPNKRTPLMFQLMFDESLRREGTGLDGAKVIFADGASFIKWMADVPDLHEVQAELHVLLKPDYRDPLKHAFFDVKTNER